MYSGRKSASDRRTKKKGEVKSTPRQRLFGFARPVYPDEVKRKERKKPAFAKVAKAKSDPSKNIWFWSWVGEPGGGTTTCANVPNQFARHWCRRRAFALSKPCECCSLRNGVENRKLCRGTRR